MRKPEPVHPIEIRKPAPGDEVQPGTGQAAPASCRICGGSGRLGADPCPTCGGTGQVEVLVGDA